MPQSPHCLSAMRLAYELGHGFACIDDKVMLVWTYSLKAGLQQRDVHIRQGIGHKDDRNNFGAQSGKIVTEAVPVPATKERITSHRVTHAAGSNRASDQPTA